uniref:Uncharacterized protein n=1 Tax=uncultured prokaryote TaxID=198431 RepID=A0A0H5QJV9_9ZZZZ|nr:hypothetical protein [uncultured prokaryote]
MNVSVTVRKFQDRHLLSVVARPRVAAVLGEHVLIEGQELSGLPLDASAVECLRAAFTAIGAALALRDAVDVVDS